MDVESLAKQLILKGMTEEQQKAVLDSIRSTMASSRELQKQRVGENARLVVEALRKIEADIRSRYDEVGNKIEERVASIKDGKDGRDGVDGRPGKDGRPGRDGATGPRGADGLPGRDGRDGVDGVSVTDARIDFDGSLIIGLSSGREINVGEVVAPDLAEKIKVITNGGGTSQSVLDALASLQTQINNLIPSQTGNAGKFLTTNGSVLSWASVAGGLSYQGTWNASTNTPTLSSGVGTNGYYYIVATAGSTNLDGITDWQIGDWLLFNGSNWQKIDQSELVTDIESIDNSVTVTFNGSIADLSVYSSPRLIAQVRNETGSTLTKGTVVYINGASGNKATVTKALATNDATSAQTFGLVTADISTNNNGYVILAGEIAGLDTSAFAAGTQLYLSSTTAGAYTSTKQYAPNHLVYIGVVTRSHANQGTIEVRIQNGYEMDELHNVSAQNPSNGQVLIYNASTSLWEKNTLTDGNGISITEGAGSITITNSGVRTAQAGTGISVSGTNDITITNTAPDQTVSLTAGTGISTSGTYPSFTVTNTAPDQTVSLTGAGTTSISGTYPNFTVTSNDQYTGTVTSVALTVPTGLTVSGSPITSSGTLAVSLQSGYSIPTTSSQTNWDTAYTDRLKWDGGATGLDAATGRTSLGLGTMATQAASNVAITGGSISGITDLAIADGGTGASTANSAFNNLAPSQSGNSGKYLTTDGTNTSWAAVNAGGGFAAGTRMIFAQTAAPTGWTKDTVNYNNHALRVVTGTAASGGSVDFTTAFASQTPSGSVSVSVSGSVGSTTLSAAQIPSHTHNVFAYSSGGCNPIHVSATNGSQGVSATDATSATGSGSSHNHSFSGSGSGSFSGNAINLAVKYLDTILATKD